METLIKLEKLTNFKEFRERLMGLGKDEGLVCHWGDKLFSLDNMVHEQILLCVQESYKKSWYESYRAHLKGLDFFTVLVQCFYRYSESLHAYSKYQPIINDADAMAATLGPQRMNEWFKAFKVCKRFEQLVGKYSQNPEYDRNRLVEQYDNLPV